MLDSNPPSQPGPPQFINLPAPKQCNSLTLIAWAKATDALEIKFDKPQDGDADTPIITTIGVITHLLLGSCQAMETLDLSARTITFPRVKVDPCYLRLVLEWMERICNNCEVGNALLLENNFEVRNLVEMLDLYQTLYWLKFTEAVAKLEGHIAEYIDTQPLSLADVKWALSYMARKKRLRFDGTKLNHDQVFSLRPLVVSLAKFHDAGVLGEGGEIYAHLEEHHPLEFAGVMWQLRGLGRSVSAGSSFAETASKFLQSLSEPEYEAVQLAYGDKNEDEDEGDESANKSKVETDAVSRLNGTGESEATITSSSMDRFDVLGGVDWTDTKNSSHESETTVKKKKSRRGTMQHSRC
jgi:hypothetical protein